jgi:Flp pilus assembly protein TadG
MRMASGEEVITEILDETDDTITVSNPIVAVPGEGNKIGFVSWAPFLSNESTNKLDVSKKFIVFRGEVNDDIHDYYTNTFSTIIKPTRSASKLVL